jgi:hypothetical protein
MIIFWSASVLPIEEKRGYINSTYIEVRSFRLLGHYSSCQSGSLTHDYLQYFQRTSVIVGFLQLAYNGRGYE